MQSLEDGTIDRSDMVPAQALVSLFLLADVDFVNAIATVKTDESGNYTVTAADVLDYLVGRDLVVVDDDEETVMTAFRGLGRLQVRAVIIKEQADGSRDALAIQSIADPNDVDESTGLPVPVPVDPIVHRVVKVIVDQIRESIDSLRDMGVSSAVVDDLTATVIQSVAAEITRVVAEAADSIIEIPEGQSAEDVISQQETDIALAVTDDDINDLASVIDGTAADEDAAIATLEDSVVNANEEVSDEDSTLESSLGSDEQGLLSSLESLLGEAATDEVDDQIENATDEELEALFGLEAGASAEEALGWSGGGESPPVEPLVPPFIYVHGTGGCGG